MRMLQLFPVVALHLDPHLAAAAMTYSPGLFTMMSDLDNNQNKKKKDEITNAATGNMAVGTTAALVSIG